MMEAGLCLSQAPLHARHRDELILVALIVVVVTCAAVGVELWRRARIRSFVRTALELGLGYVPKPARESRRTIWSILKAPWATVRLHEFQGTIAGRSFVMFERVTPSQRGSSRATWLELGVPTGPEVTVYAQSSLAARLLRSAGFAGEVSLPDPDFAYRFLVLSPEADHAARLLSPSVRDAITQFSSARRGATWRFRESEVVISWDRALNSRDVRDAVRLAATLSEVLAEITRAPSV